MWPVVQATFLSSLELFHSQPCVINVSTNYLQLVDHGLGNGSHHYEQSGNLNLNRDEPVMETGYWIRFLSPLLLTSEWPSVSLSKLLGLGLLSFQICPTHCWGMVCLPLGDVQNRIVRSFAEAPSSSRTFGICTCKDAVECAFDTDGDRDLMLSRHHLHCRELWIPLEEGITCTVRNSNEIMGKARELTCIKHLPYASTFSYVVWNDLPNKPGRSMSHSVFQSRQWAGGGRASIRTRPPDRGTHALSTLQTLPSSFFIN